MFASDKENAQNVLIFSPPRTSKHAELQKKVAPVKAVESMICAKFQTPMCLDFDTVLVGSCNSLQFLLINPNKGRSVKVSISKIPETKGFDIMLGPDGSTEIEIEANGKVYGVVLWAPKSNMSVREVAKLTLHHENGNATHPLQITLVGKAGTGKVSKLFSQHYLVVLILC